MRLSIRLEWDPACGLWFARVPAIEEVSASAETRTAVLARVRRALEAYLADAEELGMRLPQDDAAEWTTLDLGAPALKKAS